MASRIRNVTLAFPCRENWNQFEVVPGGRLCQSCAHVVRDFRDCTMAELKTAMRGNERVCGRFNSDQLSKTFLKTSVSVVAAGILAACNTEPVQSRQAHFVTLGIPIGVEIVSKIPIDATDTLDLRPGDKTIPVSLSYVR